MTTAMSRLAAEEHAAELRRVAERRRTSTASRPGSTAGAAIQLRVAHADEADVVRQLAALDDAPELEGQVLLALIDGEAVAGLSLRDGSVVANPFIRTREAVVLLRLRAKQLSAARARRRRRGILHPRFA
jgi:hypothetical protein